MNALQILRNGYNLIKDHWCSGALVKRQNMHEPTYCAMGGLIYGSYPELAKVWEARMESELDAYKVHHFGDQGCERFLFSTSIHDSSDLSSAGQEATYLLAMELNWDQGECYSEPNLELWEVGSAREDFEEHVISANDDGPDSESRILQAYRDAIARLERQTPKGA